MAGGINWGGDPTWTDVQDYLDATAPPPQPFWKTAEFWLSPSAAIRDLTGAVNNADESVSAWLKSPVDTSLLPDLPKLPSFPDIGAAVAGAIANAEHNAADAAKKTASNTWSNIAPYVAVGALLWLAVEVRKAR